MIAGSASIVYLFDVVRTTFAILPVSPANWFFDQYRALAELKLIASRALICLWDLFR